jgi:hypothetical protein
MNLSDLRTAVYNLMGVPAADALLPAAKLTEWINQSLQEISAERDWPWLDATDPTTALVAATNPKLPCGWRDTRTITINGSKARLVTISTSDDWLNDDDRSRTHEYAIEGGDIVITPAPSGGETFVHRYVMDEPVLEDDLDEPLMPARWHYAIINKACKYAAVSTNDVAGSKVFEEDYQGWLAKMNRAIDRSHGPRRVRVRPGSGL